MSAIGIVILAAGASTRMGTPKQLLLYKGRSFLRHITDIALATNCDSIVVVLGAYADQIKPEVNSLPVHTVINPHWAEGMGRSIRVGISILNERSNLEAAIVLLCDQPFLSVQFIHRLIETYNTTGQLIVASSYREAVGVPALFHRQFFPALLTLDANQGAKHLIKEHTNQTACVSFPQGAIDIDTPKDYAQLQSGLDVRQSRLELAASKRMA